MGVILFQALSKGAFPYYLDASNRPNLSTIYDIQDPLVPQEIKDLVRSMLNPDYKKRPSAEKAFNILDKYIKDT